ncbi:hypothetical protein HII36_21820 [Nonomuraea sp. NN258]|uniref:hypothetical protein n=1 Tax=Nonomuraea antri TaxID=2730852 RepID=UPI0015694427|nr:hypothetical protein [Nonomuraea antri]NRQ34472.1 hypothetical protein [Nonomuraea antri]
MALPPTCRSGGMWEFGPCPHGRGVYTTGTCHQPLHHGGDHVFEYPRPRPVYRSRAEAAEVEGRLFGTHPSWFGLS